MKYAVMSAFTSTEISCHSCFVLFCFFSRKINLITLIVIWIRMCTLYMDMDLLKGMYMDLNTGAWNPSLSLTQTVFDSVHIVIELLSLLQIR